MRLNESASDTPALGRRAFLEYLSVLGISTAALSACGSPEINEDSGITLKTLESAEKIAGIKLTPAERKKVLAGVLRNMETYDRFREQHLDFFEPPSMVFNPAPPGMEFSRNKKTSIYAEVDTRKPRNSSDLAYLSVLQLASLIKTQQVTSLGLTELYLSRLKKYNRDLEFVVTLTEDLAFKQAEKADREISSGNYRGLLHGIPYGIKDLFAVKGYRTTWGSKAFKDRILDFDATVVEKLETSGAVLVAKLATGELASGERWFGGRTKSPWTMRPSGGSSAGPASAVAAGCIPFAIGTETNGSMVSPCDVCGVTGLRPTFGRVSRYGCMPVSWSFDKVTPIARTVEDCAAVFQEILGPDQHDNSIIDLPFNWDAEYDISSLKIGYHSTYFDKDEKGVDLEEDQQDWFNGRKSHVKGVFQFFQDRGFNLVPLDIQIPHIGEGIMMMVEAAAAFDEFTRSNTDDQAAEQKWPDYHKTHRFVPAVEYLQAARYREVVIQKMNQLIKDIDVYIEMTWSTNWSTNVCGLPIVVVPCGFTSSGQPRSVTFVGKLYQEAKLMAVAKTFQDATAYHLKKPTEFR